MLIDSHTHFYDEWLLPDADAAVARALAAGVGKMALHQKLFFNFLCHSRLFVCKRFVGHADDTLDRL